MTKNDSLTLTNRLREALRNGCAYITWLELHEWYNMDRITSVVRQDLAERWEDAQAEYANFAQPQLKLAATSGPLLTIERGNDGFFLFGANRVKDFAANEAVVWPAAVE